MNAGDGVLSQILSAVESQRNATDVFAKFVRRYPKDTELAKTSGMYSSYLASGDAKKLVETKKRLKNLIASRTESSGGGDIPLEDLRKKRPQTLGDAKEH
jgi:hypothetical protein